MNVKVKGKVVRMYTMNVYVGVAVYLHSFLNLKLWIVTVEFAVYLGNGLRREKPNILRL
jgi:hypothetical protein